MSQLTQIIKLCLRQKIRVKSEIGNQPTHMYHRPGTTSVMCTKNMVPGCSHINLQPGNWYHPGMRARLLLEQEPPKIATYPRVVLCNISHRYYPTKPLRPGLIRTQSTKGSWMGTQPKRKDLNLTCIWGMVMVTGTWYHTCGKAYQPFMQF